MKRSALLVTIVPLLAIAYLVYEFAHPPWTPLRLAGLVARHIIDLGDARPMARALAYDLAKQTYKL